MALKFNLVAIDKEDVKKAEERGRRYDGPTPPPDVYNVVLKSVWFSQTKAGKDTIRFRVEIKETGDKEIYNGCSIFNSMMLPIDKSEKAYPIQVSQLNDFVKAASGGKVNLIEFASWLTEGKIKHGKKDKVGVPVEQIGRIKFDGSQEFVVKTKLGDNQKNPDNPYVEIHYIDTSKITAEEPEEEDIIEDEDDIDDIDELMADMGE